MQKTNHMKLRSQRGAVLIVALVLLLVLTILGTAGIQDTTMEERMAGNYRDHSAAMAAAETALRLGEDSIAMTSVHNSMQFDSSDGTYEVFATSRGVDPHSVGSTRNVDAAVWTYGGSALVSAAPEYYIEKLPIEYRLGGDQTKGTGYVQQEMQFYRVTGIGTGISPNSEVILQSTYYLP